jgi:two-component system, response regulator YesN
MRNRVVLYVPAGEELYGVPDALESFMHQVHARLCTRLGLRIKMGVSRIENNLSRSLSAYNESLTALNSSESINEVLFASLVKDALHAGEEYPADLEKKMLDRVLAGDLQSVHGLYSSITEWLFRQYSADPGVIRSVLFEILVRVRSVARDMQSSFGGFHVWKDTWKRIDAIDDLPALASWVLSGIDECLSVIIEHKQKRMSPIIVKACSYIDDNLSRDISLDDVSRKVEVSPFYFSKLFKEETGENFIDYVTMARMQKAKTLLRDLSLSVKEISAESGYSDPNYFSKLFKKCVGLTPTEYRERS